MRENSQVRATKKNQPREQLYLMEFKTTFQWVATGGSGWLRLPRGARLKNEFEPQLHEVTFDMARQINRNAPLENVKKEKLTLVSIPTVPVQVLSCLWPIERTPSSSPPTPTVPLLANPIKSLYKL